MSVLPGRYCGSVSGAAPTEGSYEPGDFVSDRSGGTWVCTVAGSPGTWAQSSSGGGGAGSDTTAVHYLQYDTTGATGSSSALQTAIDAGQRHIVIPPGKFLCDAAVFYDAEDGNSTLRIHAHGVVFIAAATLPTVAEFDTYCTSIGVSTGAKWFFFPSTYRAALSAGVVTCTGHDVTGTSTYPVTRNGISPHLLWEGGTFSANPISNYNAGMIFGNVGGATEIRGVHLDSARALLSWTGYVDANKMINCAGWGATNMSSSNDAWLFYQITSGDGVYVYGSKTDNFIGVAALDSCNGAHLTSMVGGTYRFRNCHAINISSNHTETASNISVVNRRIYYVRDSHITIQGSFDYLTDTTTDGAIYLDDSGGEGAHSRIDLFGYFGRQWLTTSDPVGGYAIYINNMNDRTKIKCISSETEMSVSGAFSTAFAPMGLTIGGNAANEPTLAAALVAGRDLIASGNFTISKFKTSSTTTGQNQAMSIGVGQPGNLSGLYRSSLHVTPTFYDAESYGSGTLANSTLYAYAAAVCNTLPNGTLQYGQVTAEWQQTTPGSGGAQGFEMYTPSAAGVGASLVIWRKTGAGVLATPDRYVVIPVGAAATRLLDTGANINKVPWVTTSVPVPNTVAAVNHTSDALYLNGVLVMPAIDGQAFFPDGTFMPFPLSSQANASNGPAAINAGRTTRFRAIKSGVLTNLSVFVATTGGNLDVGIYDTGETTSSTVRTKLWSSGSTAVAASNTYQSFTPNITVVAGRTYEFVLAADGTTSKYAVGNSGAGSALGQLPAAYDVLGNAFGAASTQFASIATIFPLPATITDASMQTPGGFGIWFVAKVT